MTVMPSSCIICFIGITSGFLLLKIQPLLKCVERLKYESSTKAAVMRVGMLEMWRFASTYYKGVQLSTFLESCGFSDVIATCYGGRNKRVAEAFVKSNKSIEELEAEMLNGQKLHGPLVALEIHNLLKEVNHEKDYPLLTAVYKICYEGVPVTDLLKLF